MSTHLGTAFDTTEFLSHHMPLVVLQILQNSSYLQWYCLWPCVRNAMWHNTSWSRDQYTAIPCFWSV